jgi:hypothetical protein
MIYETFMKYPNIVGLKIEQLVKRGAELEQKLD